jgi:hypothetical protein
MIKETQKEVAKRNPCFDNKKDERPFAVVMDVHDKETGEYIDQGEDWNYFATEEEAEKFISEFNECKD